MSVFWKPLAIIWFRDMIRYVRNRSRSLSALMMPFLWLVLFGSGISGSLQFAGPGQASSFDYIQFLFPGVLGITILFTAMFSAMSIVVDREFGFLKEILVAPVPRVSIALGKILGGATIATLQGLLMMLFLPLVGLSLTWKLFLLLPFIFLFALTISSFGVLIASRMKSSESFQMVMQFSTFPMFMLSGAFFPLHSAPLWIEMLSTINPVTYGVDVLRRVSFWIYDLPSELTENFTLSFFDRPVTILGDVLILTALGLILLVFATRAFGKSDRA